MSSFAAAGEPTMVTGRPQIAFIHILRGVAALLVVWSHLSGYWLLETGRTSAAQDLWYQWVGRPLHLYQNGGHVGVVLFFLISGYIITHTSLREDRRSFAIKRVLRILPALAVAVLVTWVIVTVAHAADLPLIGFAEAPWWRWLMAVFLLDGFVAPRLVLDVTWTLVVELIFYLLIFSVIRLQRARPLASTWIMTGIWIIGSFVFFNVGFFASHGNAWAMYWVGFLLVGRVIYFVQNGRITPVDGIVLGVWILLVFGLLVEAVSPGYLLAPGGWVGIEPLVSYVLVLLIFLTMLRWAPRAAPAPFRFFGDISYSLYLFHLPIGLFVLALLETMEIPETLMTFIAIAVSIGAATVSWLLVEKPTQKLARRLVRREASAAD